MPNDSAPLEPTPEEIIQYSYEFDELQQRRHDEGFQEYGPMAFMDNNMFDMIGEELADICNYARYQYIKLRALQKIMEGLEDV